MRKLPKGSRKEEITAPEAPPEEKPTKLPKGSRKIMFPSIFIVSMFAISKKLPKGSRKHAASHFPSPFVLFPHRNSQKGVESLSIAC